MTEKVVTMVTKQTSRIMPYLMKKGNRVAKGAVEFDNFAGAGPCQFVGFTICDDKEKGLFVLFPSSIVRRPNTTETKPFYFLRPMSDDFLENLQNNILDIYESMTGSSGSSFNTPRVSAAKVNEGIEAAKPE